MRLTRCSIAVSLPPSALLSTRRYPRGCNARVGGPVKTEEDPLDPTPVATMRVILDAIRHLEETVVDAGGIALLYGGFDGSLDDAQLELVRKWRFPIVGNGGGVWSFVRLDDAAAATVLALERGEPGTTRPEARSGSPRSRSPTASSSRSGRS
jgi:hypothetical protein